MLSYAAVFPVCRGTGWQVSNPTMACLRGAAESRTCKPGDGDISGNPARREQTGLSAARAVAVFWKKLSSDNNPVNSRFLGLVPNF